MRPEALRWSGLLILAAAGGAACVGLGPTEEDTITVWETQLVAEFAYPGLTGQAAAISRLGGTDVGIGIDGAEPGLVHAWGVHLGTCASPGQQIGPDGDYLELVANDLGSASAETHLAPRLSIENSYHVEVRESSTDGARIACGDLVRR
jgi:ABC-type amino acid transport substrate-binding protein